MPEMIIYSRGSAEAHGLKAIDVAIMQRDGSYSWSNWLQSAAPPSL